MISKDIVIQPTSRRQDVQVIFDGDVTLGASLGTSLEDFVNYAVETEMLKPSYPIIAVVANSRLRELTYPVRWDMEVRPVTIADSDGAKIYRRSLVFLMIGVMNKLHPGVHVSVNYSVPDGGYYCEVHDRTPLSADEIRDVEATMRLWVEADYRISKRELALEEAQALFRAREDWDKVRLLEYRASDKLTLYELQGYEDYYYGYMAPSTGYLQTFKLIAVDGGFILQYPRRESPEEVKSITTYGKLNTVFQEADKWLERLGVEDVGRLNRLVSQRALEEIVLVAEALHEQRIAQIAGQICERHRTGGRLVLIAGPSSSGKTTFSKRLAIQLLAHGLRPFTLEMDHYFVDRDLTPRDEQGDYDFESLGALNLARLSQDLLGLMAGDEVQLPHFDFKAGRSIEGKVARIESEQIIILEGIHGLNPDLVPNIPQDKIVRVYVSALTQLNVDMHNRVPTTDVRLLRRLVRDARSRGWQAVDTLGRWQSVRRGEKRNIFPYQEHADAMFNSALVYELAALRPLAEPLLLQVPANTPAHIEAKRLLSFLRWVQPLDLEQVARIPDTSLLREFIGGSILDHYHPTSMQAIMANLG